jgi:hypothetical protein
MIAVRTLLGQLATKEEREEAAKNSLGTNAQNRPFYWKRQADGKSLVRCILVKHKDLILTDLPKLFQSDVITFTLASHYRDIKHAGNTRLTNRKPVGALILSIQAVRVPLCFLLACIDHS